MTLFDLTRLPDSFYDDPYPTYRALREHEPVKRLAGGGVFLTRHADLTRVYQDTATFSSDKKREFGAKYGEGSRLFAHHTTSLVFNDAPYHSRVRKTILGAMIPRALAPLGPKLEALVARLLDREIKDGIADFAAAIPVEVIGDLLAVPDADRAPLRGWSLAILGALEPVLMDDAFRRGEQALSEFHAYLKQLIAERRSRPGDPERDVLTRLLAAGLGEDELIENCVFLLNAGHETTTNLIGNALELFARFPHARAGLDLRLGIEEVLRYESSNQLGNRLARRDTEIGGVEIAEGTFVTLCIGAANRDPQAFEAPEVFDVTRKRNPHLAFAAGPHQCAGMNLARMEASIALAAFLKRFPDYTLGGAPVRASAASPGCRSTQKAAEEPPFTRSYGRRTASRGRRAHLCFASGFATDKKSPATDFGPRAGSSCRSFARAPDGSRPCPVWSTGIFGSEPEARMETYAGHGAAQAGLQPPTCE